MFYSADIQQTPPEALFQSREVDQCRYRRTSYLYERIMICIDGQPAERSDIRLG